MAVLTGCGPISSSDLAHRIHQKSVNNTSEQEEMEQMKKGLTIEKAQWKTYQNSKRKPSGQWPNGVVPYILSCSFDADERGVIAEAFAHIEESSCIKFRYATPEDDDWVVINDTYSGCFVWNTG